jgi:hypothetical protein
MPFVLFLQVQRLWFLQRSAIDRPYRSSCEGFPSPNLERRRYAHQRPLVVGKCLQLGDNGVDFSAGGQPGAQHRLPNVLHRHLRIPLTLAVAKDGHDQLDLHVG